MNSARKKLKTVNDEIESRGQLGAELRDMMIWVEDAKERAEAALNLCPTVAQAQNNLQQIRKVNSKLLDVITCQLFGSFQLKEELLGKELHLNNMEDEQRQKYMSRRAVLPAETSAAIAKIRVAFASLHQKLKSQEEVDFD